MIESTFAMSAGASINARSWLAFAVPKRCWNAELGRTRAVPRPLKVAAESGVLATKASDSVDYDKRRMWDN